MLQWADVHLVVAEDHPEALQEVAEAHPMAMEVVVHMAAAGDVAILTDMMEDADVAHQVAVVHQAMDAEALTPAADVDLLLWIVMKYAE